MLEERERESREQRAEQTLVLRICLHYFLVPERQSNQRVQKTLSPQQVDQARQSGDLVSNQLCLGSARGSCWVWVDIPDT